MLEHFIPFWPQGLTESEPIQPFQRQFPYDTFVLIVSYLPRPILKRVSLACRSYNNHIQPMLWRSIRMNPSTTCESLLECYNAINNTPGRALHVQKAVLTHFITSPEDMPYAVEPGVYELIYSLLSSLIHLNHIVIDHAAYGGTFMGYRPFFDILNHQYLPPTPTLAIPNASNLPFRIKVLELYEAVELEGFYASPAGRSIERLHIKEAAKYITATTRSLVEVDVYQALLFPRLRVVCAPPAVVCEILESANQELVEKIVYVGRVNRDDDLIRTEELERWKEWPIQIRWEREERENGTWEYDTYMHM